MVLLRTSGCVLIAWLAACGGPQKPMLDAGVDAGCKPGDDCEPPVVTIEQPDGGQTLVGEVDIAGTVTDNSQVPVKIELLIDDQLVDHNDMTPLRWSFRINTAGYKDGQHTLKVRATDWALNQSVVTQSVRTEKIQLPTCPANTWLMIYWPNQTLTGTPGFARCESQAIDYDWQSGAVPGTSPINSFSLSWTGHFTFDAAEYAFEAFADDGVRVYVDDIQIINEWRHQSAMPSNPFTARKTLTAGTHSVRVEYYEETDVSRINVRWAKVP
ncbi:MAG: hypothetical protein K1X64_11240 [Myxococcaceae bacterium]|nr:hypothetical protein [Myxococcaceae bacterium]